jgi:hypothetical protein
VHGSTSLYLTSRSIVKSFANARVTAAVQMKLCLEKIAESTPLIGRLKMQVIEDATNES